MSNIIEDAFQDIEIKPKKSKMVIKWVVRISLLLIGAAFVFGQFRVNYFNRMNNIENNIIKTNEKIDKGFEDVNKRIDNVYVNGINAFIEYNDYNKKQLELIIDYSSKTDKALMKKMLELNAIEKNKNVENQLNKAMRN